MIKPMIKMLIFTLCCIVEVISGAHFDFYYSVHQRADVEFVINQLVPVFETSLKSNIEGKFWPVDVHYIHTDQGYECKSSPDICQTSLIHVSTIERLRLMSCVLVLCREAKKLPLFICCLLEMLF